MKLWGFFPWNQFESFLGRMCVVRFADYRTVDRHLTSSGLEVSKAFIYESSIEKPMEVSPGGRRTHISLEACGSLLGSGFVPKPLNEKLMESYGKIMQKVTLYKSKCEKYEGDDRIDNMDYVDENLNDERDLDNAETSSGIESGEESGASSPKG